MLHADVHLMTRSIHPETGRIASTSREASYTYFTETYSEDFDFQANAITLLPTSGFFFTLM